MRCGDGARGDRLPGWLRRQDADHLQRVALGWRRSRAARPAPCGWRSTWARWAKVVHRRPPCQRRQVKVAPLSQVVPGRPVACRGRWCRRAGRSSSHFRQIVCVVGVQRPQAGVVLFGRVELRAHLHEVGQGPLAAVEAGVERALVRIGGPGAVNARLPQGGDRSVGVTDDVVVPRVIQHHAVDGRAGLEDLREGGEVLRVGDGRAGVLEGRIDRGPQ